MVRFNLAAALVALSFFSWAQYSGWNLFDNEAGSQGQQLRSSGSGGRSYHK
jgi:hypothetical protein